MENRKEPSAPEVGDGNEGAGDLASLQKEAKALARKFVVAQRTTEDQRDHAQLRDTFRSLAREVSVIGPKKISPLCMLQPIPEKGLSIFFCGCLEIDLSQWSGLQAPDTLAGGFLLRTGRGNILFDPGVGTLSGLRETGINLAEEIDAICVSRSHPSAWYDLHPLLHLIGRPVPLLCTRSLAEKFSGAGYEGQVKTHCLEPGKICYLHKPSEGQWVFDDQHDADALALRILPAFGKDKSSPTLSQPAGDHSPDRFGLFIKIDTCGVLFTGSTEYCQDMEETLKKLVEKVDVLIANIHTLGTPCEAGTGAPKPFQLELTKDYLGFEGTCRLAELLKPETVILRSFNPECVLKGSGEKSKEPWYAPEQLSTCMRACSERLKKSFKKSEVIIPGLHEVRWTSGKIEQRSLVPVFPESLVTVFGEKSNVFRTANDALARELGGLIELLKTDPRPFMVIEGESGAGKTVLARAIAAELTRDVRGDQGRDQVEGVADQKVPVEAEQSPARSPVEARRPNGERLPLNRSLDRSRRLGGASTHKDTKPEDLPLVNEYDFAAASIGSELHGNVLFGWAKNIWHQGSPEHPGLLSTPSGVLILNQLEKLPIYESQRFLDLIENWEYKRRGEEHGEPKRVAVKIIFTTNVPLMECSNLPPDLKNRMIAKRCALPRFRRLTPAELKRDLRVYVTHWCNENSVFLAAEVMERLPEIDLSNGTIRMLRGLLENSRFLALMELGLERFAGRPAVFPIHVPERLFREAMRRSQVEYIQPPESSDPATYRELVCRVAIWISFRCEEGKTRRVAISQRGKMQAWDTFDKLLAAFGKRFATFDEAWALFKPRDARGGAILNSVKDAKDDKTAIRLFDGYLDYIIGEGGAPGAVARLFDFGSGVFHLQDRAEKLHGIFYSGVSTVELEKVKSEFITRLNKVFERQSKG